MNKSISYIFLFALFLLLSCSDEQEGVPNAKPEVQGKTIALTFTSQPLQESGVVTRSTGKGMDLLMGEEPDVSTRAIPAEEQQIDNVCIFQFEGSKESSSAVLRAMFYQENLTGNTQFITLASASSSCFLYVCANVGDLRGSYTVGYSTFQNIMDASLAFSGQNERSTLLPMSGCVGIDDTGSACVSLTRMFAKVTFTCDLQIPDGDTFIITSATLRNVPKSVVYYPSAGDAVTPTIDVISLTGTPVVSGDSKTTYSWYMPENLRGLGTADKWTERIEKNAPDYATYIEVIGDYISSGSTEVLEVTYIIYLGNGIDLNNYDVQRNHSYQITANIKGKNTTSDLRVTDCINLSADGLANCYLASKDNRWYRFNGIVRGNGNTEDYAHQQYGGSFYTVSYPNISMMPSKVGNAVDAVTIPIESVEKAGLVWENKKDIIKNVRWDSVNGCVKFETGSALGNALLAVYDKNNNILWSWHIWRTDGVDLAELNRNHVVKFKTNTTYSWYTAVYPGYGRERDLVMMECNIGAHLDSKGSATTYAGNINEYNIVFQFGRKDPVPMVAVSTGSYRSVATENTPKNITDILNYIILNPNLFITSSATTTYDWMNSTPNVNTENWCVSNCLWGDNNPYGAGNNDVRSLDPVPWGVTPSKDIEANGAKTIYDPSPAGWRVAPADAFSAITDGTVNSWLGVRAYTSTFSNGYMFYFGSKNSDMRSFFPASGIRHASYSIMEVGNVGQVWVSSSCGQLYFRPVSLQFSKDVVYIMKSDYRGMGNSVRCVKE